MKERYKTSWKEPKNYHETMESFIHAASLILGSREILEKHKKNLLDTVVWKASEAGGKTKYDTRFVSESVYDADRARRSVKINFEHVRPKKKVIKDLLASPDKTKTILYNAMACTVTRDEHKLLKDGEDWDRYQAANIKVYDRFENKFIDFA
jgi:hypothetical protein